MQQYRDIKARYPQTILFFRMGDFYEMFEDDARLAARELGLTLTSRNNGGAAEVPLAGVPVKAGTEYLRRLIAKGHRVAICEQVEDPKLAKGLVRREVVETITPGTVLAEDWLERKRNNFLLALDPRGTAPGLAALDLSTGELALETVPLEDLASALARYEAPEVVLPAGCELALLPGRDGTRGAGPHDDADGRAAAAPLAAGAARRPGGDQRAARCRGRAGARPAGPRPRAGGAGRRTRPGATRGPCRARSRDAPRAGGPA